MANRPLSLQLPSYLLATFELLARGLVPPLTRFMGEADYRSVLEAGKLANGARFPLPLVLPIPRGWGDLAPGQAVLLRDGKNELLATLTVEEQFPWDPEAEAQALFQRPADQVGHLSDAASWAGSCVSGPLQVHRLPDHAPFDHLYRPAEESRRRFQGLGRVLAVQSRHVLLRPTEFVARRVAAELGAGLLLQPLLEPTLPGDLAAYARLRSHAAVIERYVLDLPAVVSAASVPPLGAATERGAVFAALLARAAGATHLLVEREPSAQQAAGLAEIGIIPVVAPWVAYRPEEDRFLLAPGGQHPSGSVLLHPLDPPDPSLPARWLARPEAARFLPNSAATGLREGFCVWFTGLSASGKSTQAELLTQHLLERQRPVTLLDGDVVRTQLTRGLGFSREDRDANVVRVGFVAAEIVKHSGAVVCALVSPYRAARARVRAMFDPRRFLLVHTAAPIEVCEQRDPKGLYALAREGKLTGFTGVDDPYEPPQDADLVLDTANEPPAANLARVVRLLQERGLLAED